MPFGLVERMHQFVHSSYGQNIRMYHGHSPLFQQRHEIIPKVYVLARTYGNRRGLADQRKLIGVEPWNRILDPRKRVFFQVTRKGDDVFKSDVPDARKSSPFSVILIIVNG